jgi:hypothetical protein
MISSGCGHDAALALGWGELAHSVICAANLISSGALEVFGLQPHLCTCNLAEEVAVQHRSHVGNLSHNFVGALKLGESWGHDLALGGHLKLL